VNRVSLLGKSSPLAAHREGEDLRVQLPLDATDALDTVVVVEFSGTLRPAWYNAPRLVSRQYEEFPIEAASGRLMGKAAVKSMTHSRYFGNWKHDTCAYQLQSTGDRTEWTVRFLEPGDYRVILDYAAAAESKGREGLVQIGDQELGFETLFTLTYDSHQPIPFIRHSIGIVTVTKPGAVTLSIRPKTDGANLFWLRQVVLQPVR
jgi:alpha-L-fucosidase